VKSYINSITKPYSVPNMSTGRSWIKLGDNNQHDSDELITFIFNELGRETNKNRGNPNNDVIKDGQTFDGDLGTAMGNWFAYFDAQHSIIDKWWQVVSARRLICARCNYERYQFETLTQVSLTPERPENGRKDSLLAAVPKIWESSGVDVELKCEKCAFPKAKMERKLLRAPPLLCIKLSRNDPAGGFAKNTESFAFPVDNLDLQERGYQKDQIRPLLGRQPQNMEGGFEENFIYDLFAVVMHNGVNTSSGHYWCYVREGPGYTWTKCNDSIITKLDVSQTPHTNLFTRLGNCEDPDVNKAGRPTPTHLFYKRRDISWYERSG
jgi:ubiquitin carboxyl-terminal hydrolase 8